MKLVCSVEYYIFEFVLGGIKRYENVFSISFQVDRLIFRYRQIYVKIEMCIVFCFECNFDYFVIMLYVSCQVTALSAAGGDGDV